MACGIEKILAIAYYHACQHTLTNTRCSHHCCIVFNEEKIITAQTNQPGSHAEMCAVTQCDTVGGMDILVIRVSADNNFRLVNSRPCIDCANMLKYVNIRYIYFSNEYGRIVRVNKEEFASDHITRKRVHKERSLSVH